MILLETKDRLNLTDLLRIAYEYGNMGAYQPESNHETIDNDFKKWVRESGHLIVKLDLSRDNDELLGRFFKFLIQNTDMSLGESQTRRSLIDKFNQINK